MGRNLLLWGIFTLCFFAVGAAQEIEPQLSVETSSVERKCPNAPDEFYIGVERYGWSHFTEFNWALSLLMGNGTKLEINNFIPAINVGFYYNITEKLSLGGLHTFQQYSYTQTSSRIEVNDYEFVKIVSVKDIEIVGFTTIARLKRDWIKGKHATLYSSLGLGVTYGWQTNKTINTKTYGVGAAYEVTPLGVSAGYNNIHAFADFSLAYSGTLRMGLSYRF